MSNLNMIQKSESLIMAQETSFSELAKIHGAVNFKREASFALQILKANDFLLSCAASNPDSLKNAILNVAAVGLSLSPIHKLAYLVPRRPKKDAPYDICLDISYAGLIKLATDAGAIMWAVAELVCENDDYTFNGHGKEPHHKFNPFNNEKRGKIVGGYSLAKDHNGQFHVAHMDLSEILEIRDRSESFKKGSGPWVSDALEMMKKTLLRRGSKSWPKGDTRDERFAKAITVYDETEAVELGAPQARLPAPEKAGPNPKFQEIRDLLAALPREESAFIEYVSGVNKRKIEKIEDLTEVEIKSAIIQLKSWASAAPKKEDSNANT